MTGLLTSVSQHPTLVALGWALLAALWATTVVGVLLAIWRLVNPRASAAHHHAAAVLAFCAALVVAPLAPAALQAWPTSVRYAGEQEGSGVTLAFTSPPTDPAALTASRADRHDRRRRDTGQAVPRRPRPRVFEWRGRRHQERARPDRPLRRRQMGGRFAGTLT